MFNDDISDRLQWLYEEMYRSYDWTNPTSGLLPSVPFLKRQSMTRLRI
ncbi:MAG: hypothetical protein ACR2LR_27690 [Hassallia sp.]